MSKKLYEENNIQDIANAIREKNRTQNTYTVSQMGNAVRAIETQPNLETLNATENGNYLPSAGKDGFSSVHVEVQSSSPILESLNADHNGDYAPSAGKDGFSSVHVAVPSGANLESLNADHNGDYAPSAGKDGFSSVHVEVNVDTGNYVSKLNIQSYTIIKNSRIVYFPSSINVPLYLCDNSLNPVKFSLQKDFKIGVAIKMKQAANYAAIASNNTASWASAPSLEFQQTGTIGFGVPGGGTTWASWRTLGTYVSNTWYYAEYAYNASTQIVTVRYTSDFNEWTSVDVDASNMYVNSQAEIRFGGWSGHNNYPDSMDMANTFIESDGLLLAGHFLGSFPSD